MTPRVFQDQREFAEVATPLLLRSETENTLSLGLLTTQALSTMIAISQGSEVTAVALATAGRNLILSHGAHPVCEAIAKMAATRGCELPGVHGDRESAMAFVRAWQTITGKAATVDSRMSIMVADQLVRGRAVNLTAKVSSAADLDEIASALDAFAAEVAMPAPPHAVTAKRVAAGDFMFVRHTHGLSIAGVAARSERVARIAYVYTPPALRGLGHASALTYALSQREIDSGRRCALFVDDDNPVSNRVYAKLNYQVLCKTETWKLT